MKLPVDGNIRPTDMGKINSTFLWLKLLLTTIVAPAVLLVLVFVPLDEIPGVWIFLFLYAALLLRLNWYLRESRVSWFWLVVALCVPVIGILITYASISRAVISARRRNGEIV